MSYYKYPHTDFHELNLDFILDKIGDIDGAVVKATEQADRSEESANTSVQYSEVATSAASDAQGWANAASMSAESAADSAAEVPAMVNSLQTQFNVAISGLTVDDEVINARVGQADTEYTTLKARLDAEELHDLKRVTFDGGEKLGSQSHNTICRVAVAVTDAPDGVNPASAFVWLVTIGISVNSAYQLLILSTGGIIYQRFKTSSAWNPWRKVGQNQSIRILMIGNSEGQDSIAYVPKVLEDLLPNWQINVGDCYTSGADLADHVTWYDDNTNYTTYNKWSPTSHKWLRYSSSYNLKQILADADWDVVILQSGTDSEGRIVVSDDVTAINNLIPRINAIAKNAQIVYGYRWWAGLSSAGYYEELAKAQEIVSRTGVADAIWYGAALENGRTIPQLDAIGNHMIYTDNGHKCAGIPVLLCSYAIIQTVAKLANIPANIMASSWIPTQADAVTIVADKLTHGNIDDIGGCTEENVALAKQCSVVAVRTPNVVTDCSAFVGTF